MYPPAMFRTFLLDERLTKKDWKRLWCVENVVIFMFFLIFFFP